MELFELQRLGEKVILPDAKRRKVASMTIPAIIATADLVVNWEVIPSSTLKDWVELEDLGGTAPWPEGVTCKLAVAELRARRESSLSRSGCTSQDAPT